MMVLDLDRQVAAHLVAALRAHQTRLAGNGVRCPRELVELVAVLNRVRTGQDGRPLDDDALTADLGTMHPLAVPVAEAGRLMGLSESGTKRLIRQGALPAIHIGRATRVRVEDIDAYLAGLTDITESGVNVTAERESRGLAGVESMAASASHPPSRTDPPAPPPSTRSETTRQGRVDGTLTGRHQP